MPSKTTKSRSKPRSNSKSRSASKKRSASKSPRHLKKKTQRKLKQTNKKRVNCRNTSFEALKKVAKELGYKQTSKNKLCGKLGQRLTLDQLMAEAKRHS